jgi:hypothetical protein
METFEGLNFTVTGTILQVSEAEISAVEASLHCRFPSDYRRFITKYGTGFFCDFPIRIFSPESILASTAEDQQRLRDYWFWEKSAEVLTQQDAVRSIACFDSGSGDDIRFLPEDASTLFVLSHDDESITRCSSFRDLVRLYDSNSDLHVYEFQGHLPPDAIRRSA